jgi:glycerol-3-phosphate dehydrogenase
VHGGVRYLEQGRLARHGSFEEQGNLAPERTASREQPRVHRAELRLVKPPFTRLGLKLYNVLSGKYGFGPSQVHLPRETLQRLPTINREGLRGGVVYYDGQFDDARLLINMVATAAEQGATLLNYCRSRA